MEEWAAVVSATVAAIGLVVSTLVNFLILQKQRQTQGFIAGFQSRSVAEEALIREPELLRLEGFSEKDFVRLKEKQISMREAAYLFVSFKAWARERQISRDDETEAVPKGKYLRTILEVDKTREAWKVLSKAITNKSLKAQLNNTVQEIEDERAAAGHVPPGEDSRSNP